MTGALELSVIPIMVDNNNVTLALRSLNANGAQYNVVFQAPKTGNITEVGFVVDAIVGTPGRLLGQLISMSDTGAGSTATLAEGFTDASTLSTGVVSWITLDTPYSIARGDFFGVNIRASTAAGTWNSTNRLTLRNSYNIDSPTGCFRYEFPYGTSGSSKLNGNGFIAFKYDDGSIYGYTALDRELYAPAGSGTAYGNIFSIPASIGSLKVIGMAIITANPAAIDGTTLTYRLHTRSGSTATTVETQSFTTSRDFGAQTGTNFRRVIYFDNPETVNGGTDIIASFETSVTTNTIWKYNFGNTAEREAMTPWMITKGCSIDTSTNAITEEEAIYFISLLVTDITAPSGGSGGGGIAPTFGGGFADA